jgi:uncharacterized protein YggE
MLKLSGILAALSIASTAMAAGPPASSSPSVIRVVAEATIPAKPDRAELTLGVTSYKKTATAAIADNDKKMERVLAALKKEVGAEGEIKTSQVNVSPRFAERKDQTAPSILGYAVANTVRVRVADIKSVGRILDRALEAGANTVEGVSFTLKDPEAVQNEALRAASAKARTRAAATADGLGLRVGQVVSVSEGAYEMDDTIAGNVGFEAEKAFRRAANVHLEPGSIDVTATVTVTFALTAR